MLMLLILQTDEQSEVDDFNLEDASGTPVC